MLLFAGALGAVLLNISYGSSGAGLREVLSIITGAAPEDESVSVIVMRIRAPRAVAAAIGGMSLAVAGLLVQRFFANPIVEPFVLGISSGSALFVALVILGGFKFGFEEITPAALFAVAFAGALCVMMSVMFASSYVKGVVSLLVVGLMIGYICGAATSLLTAFAEHEAIANFSTWTFGTFSGLTWVHVKIMAAVSIPALFFSFSIAKSLNALGMGEAYARSMGVNVRALRYEIILLSSILTAAVTAFAGPISFIGLAVPHICRISLRTSNHLLLVPACAAGGALFSGLCDFAARNLLPPMEIPLYAITALAGAPIVVWLLAGRRDVKD